MAMRARTTILQMRAVRPWCRALLVAILLIVGCGSDAVSFSPDAIETLGASAAELSSTLLERQIPLRFVQMRLWDGQSDFVNFDAIRKRVQEANFAFKPAGVQFYIAKWERYTMPDFWRIDTDEAERTWAQV